MKGRIEYISSSGERYLYLPDIAKSYDTADDCRFQNSYVHMPADYLEAAVSLRKQIPILTSRPGE